MTVRHVHRKSQRTPEETSRLRVDRERYLREKAMPERLLAEGGHAAFVSLRELLKLHELAFRLKRERQRQRLTLAKLAEQKIRRRADA